MKPYNISRSLMFLIACPLIFCLSCKKLVEVAPPISSVSGESVFKDDISAIAVINGVYATLSNSFGTGSIAGCSSLYSGLSGDELVPYSNANLTFSQYYLNALTSSNVGTFNNNLWGYTYPIIYTTNNILEGASSSSSLSPALKQQLLGEAGFMRAFCYFYLTGFYGAVPIPTTDYKSSASLARTPVAGVYQQIINDLKTAQSLLSRGFVDGSLTKASTERVRPTYWAATALLARTYLYNNSLDSAETQASLVINNSSLFGLPVPDSSFTANNREAIWQVKPVSNFTTLMSSSFIVSSVSGLAPSTVYLSPFLLNAFENNDKRRIKWMDSVKSGSPSITYYFSSKYKISTSTTSLPPEYLTALRLAEQYLIRAEVRAKRNDLAGALSDLNSVRARAGLPAFVSAVQADILKAIAHENQIEFFTEWGHRWLDMRRTGTIDAIMPAVSTAKGSTWNTNWQLHPIPLSEITLDGNLTQNPGY